MFGLRSTPMLSDAVTLTPVTERHLAVLRELAGTIWRQHYAGIITAAQIEYMLARRFSDEALREHVDAADQWLELLRVGEKPVGYCGYELGGIDGNEAGPATIKLSQLYLLESHRGRGLGWHMLRHVEARGRELGRRVLWLQVNKNNAAAIRFYRSAGFEVIRKAVFEIGGGFVMDDCVMAKQV
jgi:diamine N-acetyltransferase